MLWRWSFPTMLRARKPVLCNSRTLQKRGAEASFWLKSVADYGAFKVEMTLQIGFYIAVSVKRHNPNLGSSPISCAPTQVVPLGIVVLALLVGVSLFFIKISCI